MFKKMLSLAAAVVVIFSVAALASADDKDNGCALAGCSAKANPEVYTVYQGVKISFCGDDCKTKFMENIDANFAKIADTGVMVEKLKPQTICPVSGEELMNREVYVDVDGKRFYLCCPKCVDAVKKDPEKYAEVLYDRGETPDKFCEKCGGVVPQDHKH